MRIKKLSVNFEILCLSAYVYTQCLLNYFDINVYSIQSVISRIKVERPFLLQYSTILGMKH